MNRLICLILTLMVFNGLSFGANLKAKYNFDARENFIKDVSGNNLHLGSYDMLPSFESAGKVGGSVRFDGSDDGLISPEGVLSDGAFSFALWVKAASDESMVILKTLSADSGFTLSTAWDKPEFAVITHAGSENTVLRSRIFVEKDAWQHISFTFDPKTQDNQGVYIGTGKLYINGILVLIVEDILYKSSETNKICIAHRADSYFKGQLDELAFYDGVLKKAEIETLAGISSKPVQEESLNLEWKQVGDVSIPVPPKQHPRLYLRQCHIPELKERMNDPILSKVWQELKAMSEDIPADDEVKNWRYYTKQRGDSVQSEMDAVRYLITKDRKLGRKAITTALELMQNTHYPPEVGDVARASGRLMVTGAIVYDWCYDLLTSKEKQDYIDQFIRLAKTLECGYPPVGQGSITGHSSEWMIMRDLISPAIAIYDEYPQMYDLAVGRFFREHLPARNWFYPAHIYHQGPNYDRARFAPDLYATWIFDRMGAGNVFHPSQQFITYSWFYRRRPDGQFLAAGDHIPMYGKTQYIGTAAMLAAAYYKDEYINYELLLRTSIESRDKFFEFLWRDTTLDGREYYDLPLTRYFGFPYGWMIARTGWDDNAAIAEFKVNAYNFLNHQHHDAGAFQIYYKGALAIDSGIYQGTSGGGMQYNSPHNKNYFKRTIAHNSLLIYDPDEVFKSIGYGGAHNTEYADNDGGQILPGNGWYGPKTLEDMFDESKNYKTGDIVAYGFGKEQQQPEYSYLKGDITDAYSDKVSEVRRSFVFLNLDNDEVGAAIIVYDKVVSTNKDFKKYWLLHSVEQPLIEGSNITIKRTQFGGSGKLINTTVLPQADNAILKAVGGEGKEFWVFGTNYENDPMPNQDNSGERGAWRVELSPKTPAEEDYFLNVMQVMDKDYDKPLEVRALESDKLNAIAISNRIVAFSKDSDIISYPTTLKVEGDGIYKILVTDLMTGTWQVLKDGEVFIPAVLVRSDDGVLYFEAPAGEYKLLR